MHFEMVMIEGLSKKNREWLQMWQNSMDEKFLGLLSEKAGCCHCHGTKNCLLSCHIVIHKKTFEEETLMLMISLFLKVCESLGMSIMFVVLLLYGGEWYRLWSEWK
jgi:hypothetical protein